MKNWPDLITKFKRTYKARFGGQSQQSLEFQPQRDETGDQFQIQVQKNFHAGLEILERIKDSSLTKDFARIMFNIQIMVFVVWWVGNVCYIVLSCLP